MLWMRALLTAAALAAVLGYCEGQSYASAACMPDAVLGSTSIKTNSRGGLVLFDANGDGVLDIGVGSRTSSSAKAITLHVSDGPGTGTFTASTIGDGWYVSRMAAADMDSDGDIDVVAVSKFDHEVLLLTNDGSGIFTETPIASVSSNPDEVAIVDFDADGALDVVVGTELGKDLYVLWNDGSGVFSSEMESNTVASIGSVAAGDVNGDGHVDLVIAASTSKVFLYPGTSTRGIPPRTLLFTAPSTVTATVGNLTSSATPDIIVTWTGTVSLLHLDGTTTTVSSSLSFASYSTIGDANDDGVPDLLVWGSSSVGALVAHPSGAYVPWTIGSVSTVYVAAIGDVDNDGRADFATVGNGGANAFLSSFQGTVFPLGPAVAYTHTSGSLSYVGVVDAVGHDGSPDLVAYTGNQVVFGTGVSAAPGFAAPVAVYSHTSVLFDFALADFDHDGMLDIAVISFTGLHIVLRTADAAFADPVFVDASPPGPPLTYVHTADLTNDGAPDVLVTQGFSVFVYNGIGGTAFASEYSLSFGTPGPLVFADVDGDGWIDVFSATTQGFALNSAGVLSGPNYFGYISETATTLADLDRDGVADVVTSTDDKIVHVTSSSPLSLFDVETVLFDPSAAIRALTVGDVNGDAIADIIFTTTGDLLWVAMDDGSMSAWTAMSTAAPVSLVGAVLAVVDYDRNGLADVLLVSSGSVYAFDGLWVGNLDFAGRTVDARVPTFPLAGPCLTNPMSVACLADTMAARTSVCRHDTLVVPSGTYTDCFADTAASVTHAVTLAAPTGENVIVNCSSSGGVVFGVEATATSPIYGQLTLERVSVVGTTSGTASVSASTGITCRGAGAKLSMTDGALLDSAAVTSGGPVLDAGQGGALLAASGCSLVLERMVFRGNTADGDGGAFAATGAGTTATLIDVDVADCGAAGSGGGVAVLDHAVLVATTVGVTGCSAGVSGGGVAVLAHASLHGSSVDVRFCSADAGGGGVVFAGASFAFSGAVEQNTAGTLGGGLLLRPVAAGINATLGATTVSNNTAGKSGGGLAYGPATLDSSITLAQSVVHFPSAATDGSGLGSLVVAGPVVVAGNDAGALAGGASICGARLAVGDAGWLTMTGNVADGGAVTSDVFLCGGSADDGAPRHGGNLPWVAASASAWASGLLAAAEVGGPVGRVQWAAAPPTHVVSGNPVAGTVVVVDVFGQGVQFGGVSVDVTFGSVSGAAVFPPAPTTIVTVVGGSGVAAFPSQSLLVAAGGAPGAVVSIGAAVVGGRAGVGVATALVRIDGCDAGWGGVAVVAYEASGTACQACGTGTESAASGTLDACTAVPECPDHSVRLAANSSANGACACSAGFYTPDGVVNTACVACPSGATCDGGTAQPVARDGFFASGGDFVACVRPSACTPTGCSPGYSGFMCNDCEAGRYTDAEGNCAVCPNTAAGVVIGVFTSIAFVAAVVGVVVGWRVTREMRPAAVAPDAEECVGAECAAPATATRSRLVPPSLSMVLVAWQSVAILGEGQWSWDTTSDQVLGAFSVANIDLRLAAPDCSLGSFHSSYLVSVVLPALLLVLVVLVLIVARSFTRLGSVSIVFLVEAVVFSVAPLLYIPMARSTLILFDCMRLPDGNWVLDADPSVACYDSAWMKVLPVGIGGVVVYVVGLPALVLAILAVHRGDLFAPRTYARYGVLYRLWQRKFFWGEVAGLGKRLALVSISLFASSLPLVQINLTLLTLGFHLAWLLASAPYFFSLYNAIETRLNLVLVVILLVGAGTHAERNSTSSKTVYGVTTVAAVVVLLFVSVWAVVTDVTQIHAERRGAYSESAARAGHLAKRVGAEVMELERADVERVASAATRPTEPAPADHASLGDLRSIALEPFDSDSSCSAEHEVSSMSRSDKSKVHPISADA